MVVPGKRRKPNIGAVRSGQSKGWVKKRKEKIRHGSHPSSITRVEKIDLLDMSSSSSSPRTPPQPLVESKVVQLPHNIGFKVQYSAWILLNIFTQIIIY